MWYVSLNLSKEKMKKNQRPILKKVLIASAGAVIVLILLDLTPVGGNVLYYGKWLQCGRAPVHAKGVGLANGVPHYNSEKIFAFARGTTPYFCTPREAELAGYSASRTDYEFPNLSTAEIRAVLDQK